MQRAQCSSAPVLIYVHDAQSLPITPAGLQGLDPKGNNTCGMLGCIAGMGGNGKYH